MNQGIAYIVLAVLFWSFDGTLIKAIPWDALSINTGRSLFSLIVLSVVFRTLPHRMNTRILKGTAAHAIYTMCFVLACVWGPAANAVILAGTAPVFSALFGKVLYGLTPPLVLGPGLLGIVGGVAVMNIHNVQSLHFSQTIAGLLIGVGGGYWGVLCNQELSEEERHQSILVSCLLQSLPLLWYAPMLGSAALPFSWTALSCLVLLGAFIGGASTCFAKGASLVDPSLALLLSNAQAPLLPFWVWLFLGELPSGTEVLGGSIVFASSLWVGWKATRSGR